MKKWIAILLVAILALSASAAALAETKKIDKLVVAYVPSRDPQQIMDMSAPLGQLLKDELLAQGVEVGSVEVVVTTSYEAAGEALSAGTADVGLIPGGTYIIYDDGADIILTATRDGLSKDSPDAKDWNDGQETLGVKENQVKYYRGLIIAGHTEKAQALAAKVNAGEALTWEDVDSVTWAVQGPTSGSGYIYPSLWLYQQFGKTIVDLTTAVQSDSYATSFARLAAGDCDVLVVYADGRRDYGDEWIGEWGRKDSIWVATETNVIGVTEGIYNDGVAVSKNSPIMDETLIAALQQAFMNMNTTEVGQKVISIYSHTGYAPATSADYDGARAVQEMLRSLQK